MTPIRLAQALLDHSVKLLLGHNIACNDLLEREPAKELCDFVIHGIDLGGDRSASSVC